MSRILVVCAMNRCRSPIMEHTLVDLLNVEPVRTTWEVVSRGVSAVPGEPICPVASKILGVDRGARHVATRLSDEEIEGHEIIIAASRHERAQIALLAPWSRPRTFTLLEATVLGGPEVTPDELKAVHTEAGHAASNDLSAPLAEYAALLHLRRGLVVAPHRNPLRRQVEGRLDLPDTHGRQSHMRVLRRTVGATTMFHRQLRAFLATKASLP